MPRAGYLLFATLAVCLTLGATTALLLRPLTTSAVQSPRISLDMEPSGNSYDSATNTMTVGSVDNCLASPAANPSTHTHIAHLVIENVEDLVGWQARLNYNGGEMRPTNVDVAPFLDTTTGQGVSFDNLPKDSVTGKHREITRSASIPPEGPIPQTALVGAAYQRTQNFAISPDTPPKSPPDDSSYSAPNGGVLAALDLEIPGDQSGRTLFMQLDNDNPNAPGSRAVAFNGSGTTDINLTTDRLGNGYHAEGAEVCAPVPTPTDAPLTPTPTRGPRTPTPSADRQADIKTVLVDTTIPSSVRAGERLDVRAAIEIQNTGPDSASLVASTSVEVTPAGNCIRLDNYANAIELGNLGANSALSFGVPAALACSGSATGSLSASIRLAIHVSADATDPDPSNNGLSVEGTVNIIGTAPLPTPTAQPGPPVNPIQQPSTPKPTPSTNPPAVGSSPSSGGSTDSAPVAGEALTAQAGAQTPAAAVLAASLPRTGSSGFGFSALTLVLGGTAVFACSAALAFGSTRLIGRKER